MVGGLKTGAPGTTSALVTGSRLICSVATDRQSYQSDHARGNVESPCFTGRLLSRDAYPPAVPATDFDRHDSYGVQAVWKLKKSKRDENYILAFGEFAWRKFRNSWRTITKFAGQCFAMGRPSVGYLRWRRPRFDVCGGLATGVVVPQRRKMSVLRRSPSCLT